MNFPGNVPSDPDEDLPLEDEDEFVPLHPPSAEPPAPKPPAPKPAAAPAHAPAHAPAPAPAHAPASPTAPKPARRTPMVTPPAGLPAQPPVQHSGSIPAGHSTRSSGSVPTSQASARRSGSVPASATPAGGVTAAKAQPAGGASVAGTMEAIQLLMSLRGAASKVKQLTVVDQISHGLQSLGIKMPDSKGELPAMRIPVHAVPAQAFIEVLVHVLNEAKKAKQFSLAERIRSGLEGLGYQIVENHAGSGSSIAKRVKP